ncbi:MAG: Alanine--tRNA ligase [Pseudomonadota bacterium]|jgi:alanyl-tRNA synthetase
MKASLIRQQFLDFFVSKQHTVVASSGLVPHNDPTLMFTNSGMVQFKDVFLGTDKRPYVRAASVQGCLRAGGKHNDLENVGYTARHHTFFEMLGNWSFGDYFKRDALMWSWELLTQVYQLPAEKLWATVYIDDQESYDIWTQVIGLPAERVVRIGDNKGEKYQSDNFWMMADTGPCGPCSEIFYDHGEDVVGGPPGSPDQDGDRYIEIWNNVFMQFDMQTDGSLKPLPAPCVDTGMGLERLAAILQKVHSNYEIDIFQGLIQAASRETGCTDLNNKSLCVIADHIRACAFLVSDGVIPNNTGRGYVLRRIIRRAIRHGYKLGQTQPFFYKLVPELVKQMGEAYPELAEKADSFHSTYGGHTGGYGQPFTTSITEILRVEETKFFETLANGMGILNIAINQLKEGEHLAGELAFKLHDTFGFPLDLTQDICREYSVTVDEAGFNIAMEAQKAKGRAAGKFKMDKALDYIGASNHFVGYDNLKQNATVLALYIDGIAVNQLQSGQEGIIVLDTTPFYAESGGQVGDKGLITFNNSIFTVQDTQKIKADVFGHHGVLTEGSLKVGDRVQAQVDTQIRAATVRNHSATHLMHKALRDVLGNHVQQKGSLVSSELTRFDFAHNTPLTDVQITEIEHRVNTEIIANAATTARLMDMDTAKTTGAMMLFGEKYGDTVRVLNIGDSVELCGGVHVHHTGDIGLFKIISESGVAAGVRRIEAVTGYRALAYVQQQAATLNAASNSLHTNPQGLVDKIIALQDGLKNSEKELSIAKAKLATYAGADLINQVQLVHGVNVLVATLNGADAQALREMLVQLKAKLGSAVIVLASVLADDKLQLIAGVTTDLVSRFKAGDLVNFVAKQVGGTGGGKPDMAMAGGNNPAALTAALSSVNQWVSA